MTPFAQEMEAEAERQEVRTLARTIWLQAHLAAFLRACAESELPTIVLKGAALAETVYPRLGLRDFRDLDILVRPADAPRARAVLESLGYAADETHWRDLVTGDDCQADFAHPSSAGPVVLELHTDLINNDLLHDQVRAAGEDLWRRARQTTLAGVPALVLGPEDQLLHLCLHLAGHHLAAPRSLRDIGYVCAAQPINWPLLVQIARRSHITRIAYAGLWLARCLMDAPVPPPPSPPSRRGNPSLLQRLALARAQDLTERRTARLRLPLLLLLSDRPGRLPRLLLRLYSPAAAGCATTTPPAILRFLCRDSMRPMFGHCCAGDGRRLDKKVRERGVARASRKGVGEGRGKPCPYHEEAFAA